MPAPRLYPPTVSDERRKEQRRRFNKRERTILELIRERHPRIYEKALVDANQIIYNTEGLLPGDKEHT